MTNIWLTLPIFLLITQLIVITFTSKRLMMALSKMIQAYTHNYPFSVKLLAFLFFPGTLIHELSHMFMATALMVHVGQMEFVPEIREKDVKLGSVEIGQTDPFRKSLIGVAPFLFGISLILISLWVFVFILIKQPNTSWWWGGVLLYIIFQIGNTMYSSKRDLEGSFPIFALLLGLIIAIVWFFHNQINNLLPHIITTQVSNLLYQVSALMSVPLILNLLIWLFATGLTKLRFKF